jgi:hypothetical protein
MGIARLLDFDMEQLDSQGSWAGFPPPLMNNTLTILTLDFGGHRLSKLLYTVYTVTWEISLRFGDLSTVGLQ